MPPDETLDLFPERSERRLEPHAPLAERMRPRRLEDLVGHEALLAPGRPLHTLLSSETPPSIILWGPPGSGKTTLAFLLGERSNARLAPLSAVTAGVPEIRKAIEAARRTRLRTLLFIDEIHRLNKAQQDALLPHVEAGAVTLVGATTENPSFSVIAPLLSRCRVIPLEALGAESIGRVLDRAVADRELGLGATGLVLGDDAREALIIASQGDARRALGMLEASATVHLSSGRRAAPLSAETVQSAVGRIALRHDRDGEEHFNVVSALIKSLRASDPDAALHYLARLLEAGEDPLYVARRLVIFASEDVGNADPSALPLAMAAHQAVERIGMPEGRIPLAQATTWLACAEKSNAAYAALGRAMADLESRGPLPVPMHLRNAPTRLMRELGYGEGYVYAHDAEDAFVAEENLPAALAGRRYYEPTRRGAETGLAERLATLRARRARAQGDRER
ncbi:MAG: replication-associated recombination protein A [Spirochaetaceae bacterium]|nr:replication-associated recombination protein A [Myxococcales bacterium]MCB9726549.1 replication-associated recombination protein A [Spirochaetaceae bacterium]